MEIRPEVQLARSLGSNRFEGWHNYKYEQRKREVTKSGEIELRRFLFSSDPSIREKLHNLRNVIKKVNAEYCEVLGGVVFGSHVKGYAFKNSDLDAYIMIDMDLAESQTQQEDRSTEGTPKLDRRMGNLQDRLSNSLRGEELVGLGPGTGIGIRSISSEMIENFCERGVLSNDTQNVLHLFHLGIGKGIYGKREELITRLEGMGSRGEEIWNHLMDRLFLWENKGFDEKLMEKRRNLYPRTLAKGKKYFLQNKSADR